jgi:hypothetical protein
MFNVRIVDNPPTDLNRSVIIGAFLRISAGSTIFTQDRKLSKCGMAFYLFPANSHILKSSPAFQADGKSTWGSIQDLRFADRNR